jgi:hypothetical protein
MEVMPVFNRQLYSPGLMQKSPVSNPAYRQAGGHTQYRGSVIEKTARLTESFGQGSQPNLFGYLMKEKLMREGFSSL